MAEMTIRHPLSFKAAILERNNEPLSVDYVTFEGPLQPGQVLVRICYSGICGKQIEEIEGTSGDDPYLPHMLGHEGSGIVVDIGPGVKKVKPGGHVVLHWMKGSGIDAPTPIYKRSGKRINAGWVTTFNEYGVVSENRITPIHKETDLSVACLLGCAVTTGVGAVINDANLRPGESIAIFGCGGVGLLAIQAATLVNGYPIVAVDRNPESLGLALKFGATHSIRADFDDVLGKISQITNGKGVKYAIVAAGDTKLIEVAAEATSVPGSIFLVGVPPAGSMITVNALAIHRQRRFAGSYGGKTMPDKDIPCYLDLYERGFLKVKELILNTVTLDNINDAIDLIRSGKNIGRSRIEMKKIDV